MRTVLLLLLVVAGIVLCGVPAVSDSISGTWEFSVELNLSTGLISPSFDLAVDWSAGPLDVSFDSSLSTDGLDEFSIEGSTSIGEFDLGAAVEFDGTGSFFEEAELTADWSADASDWSLVFGLGRSPSSSFITLSGRGQMSFGEWNSELVLNGYSLRFKEASIELTDLGFCCVEDIKVAMEFDCAGFDGTSISFGKVAIPMWDVITLSGTIEYGLDEKILKAKLGASFDASDSCIGIGLKLDTDDATIKGFEINSLNVRCDVGDVQVALVHTSAWDGITLSGGGAGDCGVTWTAQIYMKDSSTNLFNVDSLSFKLSYSPCAAFSFTLNTAFSLGGNIKMDFTFRGSW